MLLSPRLLSRLPPLLLCASLSALAAGPAHAAANPTNAAKAEKPAKPKAQRSAAPRIIPSGSEEKPRERERRLLRECKGRPNAGACLGYAS